MARRRRPAARARSCRGGPSRRALVAGDKQRAGRRRRRPHVIAGGARHRCYASPLPAAHVSGLKIPRPPRVTRPSRHRRRPRVTRLPRRYVTVTAAVNQVRVTRGGAAAADRFSPPDLTSGRSPRPRAARLGGAETSDCWTAQHRPRRAAHDGAPGMSRVSLGRGAQRSQEPLHLKQRSDRKIAGNLNHEITVRAIICVIEDDA